MSGSTMSAITRECPHGHGQLEGLAETYGLPVTKGFAMPTGGDYAKASDDGRLLPVKVWRCAQCGHVELVTSVSP